MPTLVRWDPFREMTAVQNELARVMGMFREGNGGSTDRAWAPAMDAWETQDEIVYAFDLPGIPERDIAVEFEDGVLSVSAERRREHEVREDSLYRFERRFGTFSRTIGLPQGVVESDISATYKEGVLEVHVKKPQEAKPRKIQIGVGSEHPTIEGTAKPAE
jgi:HSP20 family protein